MTPLIAPLITLTMGFVALFFTIRHFKVVRTVSYIERMNHPNMADIRARVDEWLESGLPDEQRLAQLKTDFALNARVRLFYNTIAELAIAYHYGTINRRMTMEIWDPLIPEYWEKLRFYILHRRSQGVSIGVHFEALAQKFEAARKRKNAKAPNHALQRTAPRVTVAAISGSNPSRPTVALSYVRRRFLRSTTQLPRHAPPSLSLGSLGVVTRHEE